MDFPIIDMTSRYRRNSRPAGLQCRDCHAPELTLKSRGTVVVARYFLAPWFRVSVVTVVLSNGEGTNSALAGEDPDYRPCRNVRPFHTRSEERRVGKEG